MSWRDAWDEGMTHWDIGQSPPILDDLANAGDLPLGSALVPGCGSGYDVLSMASPDRTVTGIDLSDKARERFETLREETGISPSHAEFVVGDFFTYDFHSAFDLIWDYTFLCALEPARRDDWVERCHELLKPNGELYTLLFPVKDIDKPVTDDEEGPPYRLTPDYVSDLVSEHFEKLTLNPVENSTPSRQGKEWLGRWSPIS
jgi:cyclopropane fatty-acyl-phospholipid synthase-like methyltransferase